MLERILPYFYPCQIPPWELNFPDDLRFVGAFDKYKVTSAELEKGERGVFLVRMYTDEY